MTVGLVLALATDERGGIGIIGAAGMGTPPEWVVVMVAAM